MKIHKEIVWHKGENPKKDGEYLCYECAQAAKAEQEAQA